VSSLCGCCKWCLLHLAGWCEGFYGVRISEALAAYVVLVPFPLVEYWRCLTVKFDLCMSRLFGCMSLGSIAWEYGLAAPSLGSKGQLLLHYWQT